MVYSILDRYIGRTLFYNMIIVLLILLSLSSVIKFVDELRKINQGCYFFLEAAIYIFLCIIKDIEFFLPMAILLGALLGLGMFSARSELIVMEIFGFSRLQIVHSLVKTAFPVILFGMFVNEWVAPISERVARNYRYKMINNTSLDSSYGNFWVKDGNNFVYIEKIFRYDELSGIHIYSFDKDRRLKIFCYAECAKFSENTWQLLYGSKIFFSGCTDVVQKKFFSDIWLTSITPSNLLMVVRSIYYSSSLSVFDLYRCIQFFRGSGQYITQYQLRFWKKIFFPITVIVMILMALSCVLKSFLYKLRFGMQILVGVAYSFFFIF